MKRWSRTGRISWGEEGGEELREIRAMGMGRWTGRGNRGGEG